MLDFVDVKTLAICYGLCCCTQLVAFLLQYRINRGGQGLQWWTLGSALMVFGFFVNSFRDIEPISSAVILIYSGSFMFSFLLVFIGLSEFVDNKKFMRPVLFVSGSAFIVLLYFILSSIYSSNKSSL